MNKNNNKTMNERTHNPMDVYKKDKNSNSNNSDLTNMNDEFGAEFGANSANGNQRKSRNNRK